MQKMQINDYEVIKIRHIDLRWTNNNEIFDGWAMPGDTVVYLNKEWHISAITPKSIVLTTEKRNREPYKEKINVRQA